MLDPLPYAPCEIILFIFRQEGPEEGQALHQVDCGPVELLKELKAAVVGYLMGLNGCL